MSGDRLVLDAARCDGHGICALRCPDRISLDQWGYAAVDPTPLQGRRMSRRARNVVAACPNGALSLADTSPRGTSAPATHTKSPDEPGGSR